MNNLRTNFGLGAVAGVLLAVMPLFVACSVLTSESPMPHDSRVRMAHAGEGFFWLFMLLEIGAGVFLTNRFPTQKALPAKLLLFIGFSLASFVSTFICGLLLSSLAEYTWYKLARELFL